MRRAGLERVRIHYAWVIVAVGTLVVFACIGLGRFALGMLLPSMGASLGLSYGEMGYIGTGNFTGYLIAVSAVGFLARYRVPRVLIPASLALVALSMILVGTARTFSTTLLFYFFCGLGSGGANVLMMSSVSNWFDRDGRGTAAGVMTSGSGLGMVLVGWLAPWISSGAGPEGWRTTWMVLGAMTLGVTLVGALLFRNHPREVGTRPLSFARSRGPGTKETVRGRRAVLHLGAIYFLFGFGYVIYMTFVVTTLVDEKGFSEAAAGRFWSIFGAFSLVSGPLFGGLSDRIGRRAALMLAFSTHTLAYLFVAGDLPTAFVYLSIALLGVSAWSVPAILTAAVGDAVAPQRVAAAFSMITLAFSVGQLAGPAVAGTLADATGGFAAAYLLAAALAVTGVLLSALLRRS